MITCKTCRHFRPAEDKAPGPDGREHGHCAHASGPTFRREEDLACKHYRKDEEPEKAIDC